MSEIKTKLKRMADDLDEMSASIPDDGRSDCPAALLQRASLLIEDAVGELMQVAAHREGVVGPVGYRVLQNREEKLAA